MKNAYRGYFKHIVKACVLLIILIELILHPQEIGIGIKNGLRLSGECVIPSLFAFMIFSAYISVSPYTHHLSRLLEKPAHLLFGTNGEGLCTVILGMLGGYPIGAKTVSDFYNRNLISENQAKQLFCWCVNPSPAFVITATGTFMLRNTATGVIMYISVILTSLTIGLFNKFISTSTDSPTVRPTVQSVDTSSLFVTAVASASKAMLSVCGWVLTFSAICAGIDCITDNKNAALFIKSIAEVTTGCDTAINENLPIPIICALLGFGGFAVIFQVAPYLHICGCDLKQFICWRFISGALSAFYCSLLIKIFPQSQTVAQTISAGNTDFTLSHSLTASLILLFTCIVLILEVDNKKKVW